MALLRNLVAAAGNGVRTSTITASRMTAPLAAQQVRHMSAAAKPPMDLTQMQESLRAEKNAVKWDNHDTMSLIMEASYRREGIAPPPLTPMVETELVRYDSFPHSPVSQNSFQSPKSFVDDKSRLVPTGTNPAPFPHVLGRFPAKAQSSLTSVIDKAQLPSEMTPLLETWGDKVVHIDPAKAPEVLSVFDAQRQIRTATDDGLHALATTGGTTSPAPWHWKSDPMFQTEAARAFVTSQMVEHGIDPHKTTYTQSEQTRIYNAGLAESLVKGPTRPGAVTAITDVPKK